MCARSHLRKNLSKSALDRATLQAAAHPRAPHLLPCLDDREPVAVAVGSRLDVHPIELRVILEANVKGSTERNIIWIHRSPPLDQLINIGRTEADQNQEHRDRRAEGWKGAFRLFPP
jgi:hypothetical protein